MFEYGFKVDGQLSAGPQVLKAANVGAQPHEMIMFSSPAPVTKEQIGQLLELAATGATPAPQSGLPNPEEFVNAAYVAPLSLGTTAWLATNLQPGHHVLICFVPDLESGAPHVVLGMVEVFEITG